MPAADMTISQVVEAYSEIRVANRFDAFLGSCLAVYCMSE